MVGSIASNFHAGSRSEYLAQYVFASFGTVAAVPHAEDHGIDLYCTLTERKGALAWPVAYFSVQVKSTMDPWVFDSEGSVEWLVRYPLPLLLCVVDKDAGRLRIYHTFPRFYAWSCPQLVRSLKLAPSTDTKGKLTQWSGGTDFTLGAPIIDIPWGDILRDETRAMAYSVLRFWTEVERENIRRVGAHIQRFTMPTSYAPNAVPSQAGWATQGATRVDDVKCAVQQAREYIEYATEQLYEAGDLGAAVRGALLLRHVFGNDPHLLASTWRVCNEVNRIMSPSPNAPALADQSQARNSADYVFRGVDQLNGMIDSSLAKREREETSSVVFHTDDILSSTSFARRTLARMSSALAVQMNRLGSSLCASM